MIESSEILALQVLHGRGALVYQEDQQCFSMALFNDDKKAIGRLVFTAAHLAELLQKVQKLKDPA